MPTWTGASGASPGVSITPFFWPLTRAPQIVDGSANNTSDSALSGYPGLDGNIYIHPGNRIPLIPKQSGKAFADFQATSKLAFDLNEVAVSSSYARGNENNAYKADGVYYLGPGVSPGYAITNFQAHYDLTKRLQLAVQIDNLFNHHYYTVGQSCTAYRYSHPPEWSRFQWRRLSHWPEDAGGHRRGRAPARR